MIRFKPSQTALVLIGFQKDYFDPKGALYSVVEESHRVSGTLEHTIKTIDNITESPITIVNTPIVMDPKGSVSTTEDDRDGSA